MGGIVQEASLSINVIKHPLPFDVLLNVTVREKTIAVRIFYMSVILLCIGVEVLDILVNTSLSQVTGVTTL